jgi:hypothetical protein
LLSSRTLADEIANDHESGGDADTHLGELIAILSFGMASTSASPV